MATRKTPANRLRAMLKTKAFSELVKAGVIVNVQTAAWQNNYSRQHVYRLVRAGKVKPIVRGGSQFFFFPDQFTALYAGKGAR